MRIQDIIVKLIHLPKSFHSSDLSMYELLKQTGYFDVYNQVSEAGIYDTLVRYPECVDEWIAYSEDKRTSSGWYMKKKKDTLYEVGYISNTTDGNVATMYVDRIGACAAFIKHELEDIRKTEGEEWD
jgi:hypothetical protein